MANRRKRRAVLAETEESFPKEKKGKNYYNDVDYSTTAGVSLADSRKNFEEAASRYKDTDTLLSDLQGVKKL